jgi:hypothetical protein
LAMGKVGDAVACCSFNAFNQGIKVKRVRTCATAEFVGTVAGRCAVRRCKYRRC